jgi:hypothetical protein
MKIVLAGMNDRDAAALGILVGVTMKGWTCEIANPVRGRPLPAADLYVLDLAALGLARWSVAAEADLLQLLHGRSAVVLRPMAEENWTQVQTGAQSAQVLAWLTKPYNSEAMRSALQSACATPRRSQTMGASIPRTAPAVPASRPMPVAPMSRPSAERHPGAPLPAQADAVPPRGSCALTATDITALHAAFPQLQSHALLARMVQALGSGHAQELHLSLRHSILLHPGEGWVASNAGMPLISSVCQNNEMANAFALRELSDAQAQHRLQHLQLVPQALDPFLWSLASLTVGQSPLRLAHDARLRLKGFPDYTRLPLVPDLFIQLAAICVRLPQTLTGLQAAFPACDPQLIRRFAYFCATSGLGQLSLVEGPLPAVAMAAARTQVKVAVKQGFFSALFKKLF